MKNTLKEILYIGKAKKLRHRVSSYLRTQNSGKVEVLMSHVKNIEYIVTENEYEALLLEHNLIKEHHPKYNILLRDDKTFPMIKITHEEYPRIIKTRKISNDKGEYFGPYIEVSLINTYLDLIEKNFALRRCKKIKTRQNPCLYYHIGRCTAVCAGLTSKEDYLARVKKIRTLLKGKTKMLKKELTILMHKYAQEKEYEKAAEYRDSLAAIDALETSQHVIDYKKESRNYIGLATHDNKCCIVVVHMKGGRVIDQHTTHLSTFDSMEDSLEQFLLSYYQEQPLYPEILFLPSKPSEELSLFFAKKNTIVQIPHQAKDAAILRFAKENARYGISQHIQIHGDKESVLALQAALGLPEPPLRIEGFDIAHIAGKHTTAALVSFYNGVADKAQYRYFKMKSLSDGKIDDFLSIQEAVSRRYTRLKNEKKPMPHLILIDGGLGQVNSAKEILDALELDIPIVGLAKKEEEIYFPSAASTNYKNATSKTRVAGNIPPKTTPINTQAPLKNNPLLLPHDDPASKLLQAVRNEAHRFATSFREKKQLQEFEHSIYREIKGIGEKKAALIAKIYPTPMSIVETSMETLSTTLKITQKIATDLQSYVKNHLNQTRE